MDVCLDTYRCYNELVELIIPLVPWYGMPAATSVGSRFLPLRAQFFQQTFLFVISFLIFQKFFISLFSNNNNNYGYKNKKMWIESLQVLFTYRRV